MRLTKTEIRDIFFSGSHAFRCDEELVQKLHFLLSHNYLSCEKVIIAEKSVYFSLCDKPLMMGIHDEASGGHAGHIALKLLAQQYLDKFGINVSFEQSFCGYYPDVVSTDKQTIVECGHTHNVDKMLIYFTQGAVAEIVQIPYPTEDDKKIYGYRFTAKRELGGFLETELEVDKGNILNIMNRKNK